MLSAAFATTAAAISLLGLSSSIGNSNLLVNAQALAEPPEGKFIFGIWGQSDPGFQETPSMLNGLAGINFPIFQLSQAIPVPAYDYVSGVGGPVPVAYIAATGTDADIFLTVYPNSGLANVADSDILSLALQIRTYQGSNRTVWLRWAPEMNGNWMIYGMQPIEYKEVWVRMYNIIKTEAPDTVLVWSPNTGYSYPYGASINSIMTVADQRALDTNGDGRLTTADDAYSPYYPGDQYVDWNGYSMYYKGPGFVNQNTDQVRGFFYDVMHGIDPYHMGDGNSDWYTTYCANKPTKACVISEAGAAYHTLPNLVNGQDNTQVQLQQSWWQDGPLNQTLLNNHPRLKMYIQFEFIKNETDGGVTDARDYRLLNNTQVLSAFQTDFASHSTRYVTANATTIAPPNTTAFEITPSGPVVTATVTVNSTSMIVATYTQFYSGPYVNISFAGTADPLASPTGTSTLPGAGVGAAAAAVKTGAPSVFDKNAATARTSSAGSIAASGLLMVIAAYALA